MEHARTCAGCGADVPGGAAFCPACGSSTESSCAQCGATIQADHRFCPTCGHRVEVARAEERKLVTALFADLVGSTALGESLDPEVLRLILSRYFDEMTEVIESWGGSVAKYVGDAVVAVFGLPRSHGDDADRALHAALAMAERLELLNEDVESDHAVRFVTRTGINTGEVVASDTDDVVLGDVMNTAARLEQAAEPGTILVGARTVANLSTRFRMEPVGGVEAKGKADRVEAHRLLGRPTSVTRPSGGALIGRGKQLTLLSTHFQQVVDGTSPFLVTVIGDAGIGKSALVEAFAALRAAEGVTVMSAGCLPYEEGIASWPLWEILQDLSGIGLDDDSAATGSKFRSFVARHSDDERLLHALATGAAIALEGNPLARAPAETVRRELAYAWPALLTAVARAGPVLLVVEDIHWAEDDLVTMLDRIVLNTEGPLMVVCTARPDFDENAGFGAHTPRARIAVAPLDADDREALSSRLLPGMPPADAAAIVAAAGGNPFFMEEIIAHLIDSGAVRQTDSGFERVHDMEPGAVPDTVRSLLGARIDALDPDGKEVLLAASVIGTSFWVDALAGMVDVKDLEKVLDVLEAEALIVLDRGGKLPGQRQLAFRHDLVREVAYGSISRGRAARHHALVSNWIEERVSDRRAEFIDLIAHHRATAAENRLLGWPHDPEAGEGIRVAAIDDLLAAAAAVLYRSAWEESLRLIARAEALASSTQEKSRVRLERARTRRATDRYTEAWLDYVDLIEIAETDGFEQLRAEAVIEGALMTGQMGGAIREDLDWKQWLVGLVERRLAPAREDGALEEAAALLMARSSLILWQVEGTTAEMSLAAATEAVDLAERAGSLRVMGPAMDTLAGATILTQGMSAALALVDRVLEVAGEVPDRVVANELYTTAQWTLTAAGELERAREVGERHLTEATLLGTHTRVHSHRGIVELALAKGDLTAVIDATENLLDLVEEDGGKVCDHGAVAVSARALALTEAGHENGLALFDDLEAMVSVKAQFTAPIANLERKRPFVPLEVSAAALESIGDLSFVAQAVARSWLAVPLALRLGATVRLEEEIASARRLESQTGDQTLGALADWAEAAKSAAVGSSDAAGRVWAALQRLEDLGRAYTAWRLGVDASHVFPTPPAWAGQLATKLEAGGALRSATELRSLIVSSNER